MLLTVAASGIGVAVALSFAPRMTLLALGGVILVAMLVLSVRAFSLWQKLAFVSLAGFIILSYGFNNLTPLPGAPISVGHLLLFAAVFLALRGGEREVSLFLKEPVALCWFVLVGLSVAHLVADIPRYGIVAVRDASFVFEGFFLVLGYLWAKRARELSSTLVGIGFLFLLNALYAATYPIADKLAAISPVSGIFQPVAVLGSYPHTALFLVAGALYYLLVVKYVAPWSSGLILGLAAFQMSWSFVFQSRSVYVGTAIVLPLLVLLAGVRRGGKAAAALVGSLVAFFLVLSIGGVALQGRVDDVGPDFLWQHVRSLLRDPDAPAEGSVEWRVNLLPQLWDRWTASSGLVAVGEGFGEPLIEFEDASHVVVRQPHNTHITVLLRLGALGFLVWVLMHWSILRSLVRLLRESRREVMTHDLALWFLLFYVLAIAFTTFEPWLEFSYGAIPFYILVGFALGLWRDHRHVVQARAP